MSRGPRWMILVATVAAAGCGSSSTKAPAKDGGGGGDGGGADLAVPDAPPDLSIAPATWTFDPTLVGARSADAAFTVKNGGGPAPGMTASLGGADADQFAVDTGCNGALVPGANCTVHAHFAPSSAGAKQATLTVQSGSVTTTATLTGTAVAPPALIIAPTSFDFGVQAVGASPSPQAFVVTNTGGLPTGALSVAGAGADFTLGGTCDGATLAPNASCHADVTFGPQSYGVKMTTLSITSAPGPSPAPSPGPSVSAAVSGTGQDMVTLTVSDTGGPSSGSVTVAVQSIPGLTTCGPNNTGSCSAMYARGASVPVVTLTAVPGTYSTFSGWSGACTGTALTCQPSLVSGAGPFNVTASFVPREVTLTVVNAFHPVSETALGSTAASGGQSFTCAAPGACAHTFDSGPGTITLTATPTGGGHSFVHWAGDCATSNNNQCTLDMAASHTATAIYRTQVNYAFVTSGTLAMPFGDTEAHARKAANDFCKNAAAKLGGTNWVAMISTTGMGAYTLLADNMGFMRTDGQPFGNTPDIFGYGGSPGSGVVLYPLRLDENGVDVGSRLQAATASQGDGSLQGNAYCNNFTDASTGNMRSGETGAGTADWLTAYYHSCALPSHLFCFENDSTGLLVAPAPSPVPFPSPSPSPAPPWRYAFVGPPVDSGGGVKPFDDACQKAASDAGLPGSYKALVATSTAGAASRFDLTGPPWIRTDGVPVVARASDLKSDNLLAPITTDASTDTASRVYHTYYNRTVWTGGALAAPSTTNLTCADWTSTAAVYASGGDPGGMSEWFGGVGPMCSEHIIGVYCLQE